MLTVLKIQLQAAHKHLLIAVKSPCSSIKTKPNKLSVLGEAKDTNFCTGHWNSRITMAINCQGISQINIEVFISLLQLQLPSQAGGSSHSQLLAHMGSHSKVQLPMEFSLLWPLMSFLCTLNNLIPFWIFISQYIFSPSSAEQAPRSVY